MQNFAQNGVASAHHTPVRGNCTIRSSKNDPLGTTPQIIKELRQHHSNFWENCEKTKFRQCLECLITLPLQPSRNLLHYATMAALRWIWLLHHWRFQFLHWLAVRTPSLRCGWSWWVTLEQEEHQGTMGQRNVNDFESFGSYQWINASIYTHVLYITVYIIISYVCSCFFHVSHVSTLLAFSNTWSSFFSGDCQTSGVPCVAQWSHFWGHWHHTPCITFVHQCQIQSLCNRRGKFIDEGWFQYQPAMQGVWTFYTGEVWWSQYVNKHICKHGIVA